MGEDLTNERPGFALVTWGLSLIGGLLLLYVVSFGLIYLDDLVFKTFWLEHALPKSAIYSLRLLYLPLLRLFGFA